MNNRQRKIFRACLFFLGLVFLLAAGPAWAEDGTREWRPIYDLVMRWINFGIFIYFLVKVAGPLLVNFLSSQKTEIQAKIEGAQKEKEEMLAKVQDAKDSLEKSGPRLEEIKSRIVEQGERRKQEIIDEANEHSRLMMKNAKQRIDNQIIHARNKMMNELLDMAMEKALERLPGEMTEEDNDRLIQQYLRATSAG
ncbi:MAG: ATP synthase F0 subunit B [Desulfosalsimonadaceae bacterium]